MLAASGIDEPLDWVSNAGHVGVVFTARWPERCKDPVTLGAPIQGYMGLGDRTLPPAHHRPGDLDPPHPDPRAREEPSHGSRRCQHRNRPPHLCAYINGAHTHWPALR